MQQLEFSSSIERGVRPCGLQAGRCAMPLVPRFQLQMRVARSRRSPRVVPLPLN